MKKLIFLLVFSSYLSANSQDDEGSISTDRPVQSETATVVPKKYIQGEFGGMYERGNDFGNYRNDNTYIPNALIKYGLVKHLELRFAFDYLTATSISNFQGMEEKSSESSLTDPTMGIKYSFLQADEHRVNLTLSLQSQVGLWASEGFKQEEENWQGRLTAGYNFTNDWYVLAGVGYYWFESTDSYTFYCLQTGYSFGDLTAVLEFYGNRNENFEQSAINGALVYLLNNNHQLDLSFGKGSDNNFYDYYFAIGYSARLGF